MEFLVGKQGIILFILLFLGVTFVQSSIDKIVDWKGNVAFIQSHFAASPLRHITPLTVGIILIMETITSIFIIVGIGQIVCFHTNSNFSLWSFQLSGVCLLCLLIGQRLAKDYAGAVNLAIYFLLTIFGMYLCL